MFKCYICKDSLVVKIVEGSIMVQPCPECIDAARNAGIHEGAGIGYINGYEEGQQEKEEEDEDYYSAGYNDGFEDGIAFGRIG